MPKLRSDCAWSNLSAPKQAILEAWLFDEKLAYREILPRAQKELGVKASLGSLSTYYQRLQRERKASSFTDMFEWDRATHLSDSSDANPRPFLQLNLINLIHVAAYEFAIAEPGEMKVKKLGALMKVLLQNRRQDTRERELNLEIERFKAYATIAASQEARAAVKLQAETPGPGDTAILEELVEFLRKDLFPGKPMPKPQSDEKPGDEPEDESTDAPDDEPNDEPGDQKEAA